MPAFRDRNDTGNFFDLWNGNFTDARSLAIFAKASGSHDAIISPGPQALIDNVPGDTSTTATLTVGAAPIVSAIDTIGDQDFYRIELVAGHQYQIGLYGYTPAEIGDPIGPNGLPLLDSYLELYDSAGNLITAADGGSDTVLNSANSGFDALLTFTATATGTYYVNARAFDNVAADGPNGDLIGDYGLYAEDVTGDETLYTPYYEPNNPLYAIDWGTQVNRVHQTYRNPDGNEGTHETGNVQSSIDPGAALGQPGKNVITIYFAQAGDIFVSNDLTNPGLPPATITATGVQAFEHTAVMTALHEFEKVADIVYVEVSDRAQADFIYTSYLGTPGPGVSLLGSMSPPDESDEGLAQFNSGDERWNATNLAQGGFSFVTLIHEFGHGHGLAHPHDNGGHSGIMNGVESEGVVADYTLGDYDLNQSVFTMMSYEDGWQSSPYGNADTDVGYGYLGGLMAFDIAAIQDKYGVNEEWATGNDVYVLRDENAAGTYYSSIWDGGGNDSIVYAGARDANIDLRAATLQYENGGGGWVSYAYGIYGGFTIANSVVIENAFGGSGNDQLIGNSASNLLAGGGGADIMAGGEGDDRYIVDGAFDTVIEAAGQGYDILYTTSSYSLDAGNSIEVLSALDPNATDAMNLSGNELNNWVHGNNGANLLSGGYVGLSGVDRLIGFGGDDRYIVDDAADVVGESAGQGYDIIYTTGSYSLDAGNSIEVLSALDASSTNAMNLRGNELNNWVHGNDGANLLSGGYVGLSGVDRLIGFGGDDRYIVDDAADVVGESAGQGYDIIYTTSSYSLDAGNSIEVLSALDASSTNAINLSGNALDNWVHGNNGANVLNGGGGADRLVGFGGADNFAFTTALGEGNVDTIVDFLSGVDKIQIDDAVFTGLGFGTLAASAFAVGAVAQDADDRILYDQANGALYFDVDGVGGAVAVQVATLAGAPVLAASDFVVI